jgi:hypothetical protein
MNLENIVTVIESEVAEVKNFVFVEVPVVETLIAKFDTFKTVLDAVLSVNPEAKTVFDEFATVVDKVGAVLPKVEAELKNPLE